MKQVLILAMVALLGISASDHPMHLAAHELTVGAKRTEWTVRIFTDDLEDAVAAASNGARVRLEQPEGQKLATDYLLQRLTVAKGKRRIPLNVDRVTYQPDVVEFTMHLDAVLPITVTDRILHERFGDQRNVYFVRHPKGRLDAVSTPAEPTITLTP